jgi:hypothetical protein
MGRRKMDTVQVTCRINFNLLEELKLINPALVTQSTKPDVELKFRHGALGKYIGRLISADIEERKKRAEDELLAKFR